MTDPIEIMARAHWRSTSRPSSRSWDDLKPQERTQKRNSVAAAIAALTESGFAIVPVTPTEAQWGGLARAIIMWLDFDRKTPAALFQHLERSIEEIPDWLRDEHELKRPDHVPSKGTRAAIIYRAMIEAGRVKA